MIGSSLNDVVAAANSGSLRVDPATGDATIRAITDIPAELNEVVRRMSRGGRQTKLGGGYAQQIDSFNREWTMFGVGSAAGALEQFRRELLRLEDAARKCMATYQASDAVRSSADRCSRCSASEIGSRDDASTSHSSCAVAGAGWATAGTTGATNAATTTNNPSKIRDRIAHPPM